MSMGSSNSGSYTRCTSVLYAAKVRSAILQEKIAEQTPYIETYSALRKWTDSIISAQDATQTPNLLSALGSIRLPVFYSYNPKQLRISDYIERTKQDSSQGGTTVVVKAMFSLDGQILATPQAVRSNVQHDLKIELAVAKWPKGYDSLEMDYVSTMAPNTYFLTPLRSRCSNGNEQRHDGHCIFYYAQPLISIPAVIKGAHAFCLT